jgi:hypothetical protein
MNPWQSTHDGENCTSRPLLWNSAFSPNALLSEQVDMTIATSDTAFHPQQNDDYSMYDQNWFPNTEPPAVSQSPSQLPTLHNTMPISRFGKNIEGAESMPSPLRLQPQVQLTRQLPRARRGGRRGPLTAKQVENRQAVRLSGVCIRCRKTRIKVSKS